MKAHYWRMRAYAPYFDARLSWSSKAWVYQSAYAIYPAAASTSQHPEWILRDAAGNKLYIPFGCSGGTCPQYAADIGNPAFRAVLDRQARARLAKGYAGIYIDDVNLYRKVCNGAGQAVAPIDPRTGAAMSGRPGSATWPTTCRASARRSRRPRSSTTSIWFAGETTADQLRASCARPTSSTSSAASTTPASPAAPASGASRSCWRSSTIARPRATASSSTPTRPPRPAACYGLAAYLLISSGRDGVGNDQGGTTRPTGGRATTSTSARRVGRRYFWNGVLRRDFERGFALVNEPGAPTRTLALAAGARDLAGVARTSVTLPPASGAVFVTGSALAPVAVASASWCGVPMAAC